MSSGIILLDDLRRYFFHWYFRKSFEEKYRRSEELCPNNRIIGRTPEILRKTKEYCPNCSFSRCLPSMTLLINWNIAMMPMIVKF